MVDPVNKISLIVSIPWWPWCISFDACCATVLCCKTKPLPLFVTYQGI